MTSGWGQRRKRARLTAAVVLVGLGVSSCALRRPGPPNDGIPRCPTGVERDLLSSDALQCWFASSHGRWRTLGHQSHLEALVVEVEALDLDDAQDIARRFVDGTSTGYSEILVYVWEAGRDAAQRVRRVRWTRETGFATLDFTSPPGEPPLTVRSLP
jgi:hypothetical protein